MFRLNDDQVSDIKQMCDEDTVLHCMVTDVDALDKKVWIEICPIDGPLRGHSFMREFEIVEV